MVPAPDATRLVITGLGLVLPFGAGVAAADAVFAGRSAVRRLPVAGLPPTAGAPVHDFRPLPGTEGADRAVQFALWAADEAWTASGLARAALDPRRTATLISLSKGGLETLLRARESPSSAVNPWLDAAPDAAARAVAGRLGLAGPVLAPVTACASGGHALLLGATLIRRGVADAVLVGAAEASLHPLVLGSYHRMGVLAPPGDDPSASVRPFSVSRRGFAVGEGAGVLVLESAEAARRRGAVALAEVSGGARGCQATGLTDMSPDGATLARLMTLALERASRLPHEVDYVHAHGTATLQNDLAEARAIRAALGSAADRVSVSSTKGAHGHLLGAATAVELVLVVLALRRGQAPPTVNLTDQDPLIGLDCTPLTARVRPIRCAIKMASGFGGQMAVVVLTQPKP
jgi:3-oxoacyl-[acyl-carrier-protein] synthase II